MRFLLKLSKKHPCANTSKGVELSAIGGHNGSLSDERCGLCRFVRGGFELPSGMEYRLIHLRIELEAQNGGYGEESALFSNYV